MSTKKTLWSINSNWKCQKIMQLSWFGFPSKFQKVLSYLFEHRVCKWPKTLRAFAVPCIFLKFLLLLNYSCMPFLPIPPPHPSWPPLPPSPPPSPLVLSMCPLLLMIGSLGRNFLGWLSLGRIERDLVNVSPLWDTHVLHLVITPLN